MDKFFMTQAKRTNEIIEKGCVVKDTLDDALQSFHAYLGAYGYGHDPNTDYVMVQIVNGAGVALKAEVYDPNAFPPEPEPESELEA